jgi:hypothetical protein
VNTLSRRLCLIVWLCGFPLGLWAQPDSLWSRAYGGSQIDLFYAVCQSPDSQIICAGETQSRGVGGRDVWLVKLTGAGDTLWSRTYGGALDDECFAVRSVPAGGYILAGRSSSFGSGGWNGYLVRVTATGDTLWTRTFGGPRRDELAAVEITDDGGFIAAGLYGGSKAWAIGLSATGDSLWSRTYGGARTDQCYALTAAPNGQFLLAGSTESFGHGQSSVPDYWLLTIQANGDSVGSRTYGGTGSDIATCITPLPGGGMALGGYAQSFGAGGTDFWVLRLSSTLDSLTSRTFGTTRPDFCQAVWTTHDGRLVIAGMMDNGAAGSQNFWMTQTDLNFNPFWIRSYGGTSIDEAYGGMELPSGKLILAGGTYSMGAGSEDGYVVSTYPPVAILTVSPRQIDFGSVLVGTSARRELLIGNQGSDTLILQQIQTPHGFASDFTTPWTISQNLELSFALFFQPDSARVYDDTVWVVTTVDESPTAITVHGVGLANGVKPPAPVARDFQLYPPFPNPFNAVTVLTFELPRADRIRLTIFDSAGRRVATLADGVVSAGVHSVPWDATGLSSGVYFAELQGSGPAVIRKLVLLK